MQTSVPLLYSLYEQIDHQGPIRKIKLLPIKTLIRFSMLQTKKKQGIKKYLALFTILFAVIGILVATILVLIPLN